MSWQPEPARLLVGLTALGVGIAYVLDAVGRVDLPGARLLLAVPAAFALAALVKAVSRR